MNLVVLFTGSHSYPGLLMDGSGFQQVLEVGLPIYLHEGILLRPEIVESKF
jgi:hypothetical protein